MSNAQAPRNVKAMALSVRFTEQDLTEAEVHIERLKKMNPRMQFTRTDAIIDLFRLGAVTAAGKK